MDFDQVADELYALPATGFTAARDAAARRAKTDRQPELARRIAALRRPTTPAWAVNQLTRQHRRQLQDLLDLGAALRRAQAGLDADALRRLTTQRHQVLDQLTRLAALAAAEAGQPLSARAREEVEQTLTAAAADQQAADQLAAGRLSAVLAPPTTLPDLAPLLHAAPGRATAAQPPASGRPRKATARSGRQDRPDTAREEQQAIDERQAQRLHDLQAQRDGLAAEATRAARAVADAERVLEPLTEQAARATGEVERAKAALEAARFAERSAKEAERGARTALVRLRKQAEQARRRAEEAESRLAAAQQSSAKRS
ncbi:chromosome segregation ATPase [Kitasatospora sp. GP30]|uniref:hypothetical protein n=1 Tax=Kitasatospora sp. GP30 TaxID=3035084 RepID=UPI000C712266|nr:hypothetical protein [Kitasatospora sp. GP30]MDH6144339.1 chromosome segregation ATPase [Kitasatospora sp. GP30]